MFYKEAVKGDKRKISRLELLTYWLQGLCSTVNIAYEDYEIKQIRKLWKCHDHNFVGDWFKNIAKKMLELAYILGVGTDKYLY